jgi:hypothetical protein
MKSSKLPFAATTILATTALESWLTRRSRPEAAIEYWGYSLLIEPDHNDRTGLLCLRI